MSRRFQKLRKTAGLVPTDRVDMFYDPSPEAAEALASLVASHGAYLRECLGVNVLHASERAPSGVIISAERTTIGSPSGSAALAMTFTAILATLSVTTSKDALLSACNG